VTQDGRLSPLRDLVRLDGEPFVVQEPGHLMLHWPGLPVEIHVRDFGYQNGWVQMEVWFHDLESGERQLAMAPANVQLWSQQARANLIRYLHEWDSQITWKWLVECTAGVVRRVTTAQNPLQEIVSDPSLPMEPDYLLWPLLYRGHSTILFGSKGSTKSVLATVVAYIVQLPFPQNKLGFKPGDASCTVAYCDWEDAETTFQSRWTAIQRGFKGQHPEDLADDLELPILRKSMTTRLADAIEPLRIEIAENNVGLVIIDSLGPAAGGDLYAPQAALDFYAALRSLNVTTLILAHHSKDPNTKTKTVFGSQFFTALARSVWHAESESTDDPGELIASITETECNLAPKHGTLGFRYEFNNEARTVTVTQCDLEETGLRSRLPVATQVKAALRSGAKTVKQLAEEVGIAESTIGRTLRRLQEKGIVRKVGDLEGAILWGLAVTETA